MCQCVRVGMCVCVCVCVRVGMCVCVCARARAQTMLDCRCSQACDTPGLTLHQEVKTEPPFQTIKSPAKFPMTLAEQHIAVHELP